MTTMVDGLALSRLSTRAVGNSSDADEVLTVDEAAARMKMSTRYVRRLIGERRIAFHRVGRSVRLRASDVDAHVDAGRVQPLTAADVWAGLRGVG